jgi:hypothetical protein
MFLMMTNGFGCILGGVVSGKVVEMYTTNGITDWQPVWLIFAAYSLVLAFAFIALFKYKHVRVPAGAQTIARINRLPPPPALQGRPSTGYFAKTHPTDSKSALPPGLRCVNQCLIHLKQAPTIPAVRQQRLRVALNIAQPFNTAARHQITVLIHRHQAQEQIMKLAAVPLRQTRRTVAKPLSASPRAPVKPSC